MITNLIQKKKKALHWRKTILRLNLKLLIVIYVKLGFSSLIYGQTINEQIQYLNDHIKESIDSFEEVKAYLEKQELSQIQEIKLSEVIGRYYREKKDLSSAINTFKRGLEQAYNLGLDSIIVLFQYEIGITYLQYGFKDLASEELYRILDSGGKDYHPGLEIAVWTKLGNIFKNKRQYDLSKTYYRKAITHQFQDGRSVLPLKQNLAGIYGFEGNLDSSLILLQEVIEEAELLRRKPLAFGARSKKASVLFQMGRLNEAKELALMTNKHFDIRKKNFPSMISVKKLLGNIYTELGEFKEAESYYKEALNLASATKRNAKKAAILEAISNLYMQQDLYLQSLTKLKEAQHLRDSLENDENVKSINELNLLYQTREKETEISSLKKQQEIDHLKIKDYKKNWLLAILGIGALALILFFAIKSLFEKKKAEKILRKKNEIIKAALSEKELLIKEIHHRVKNNLQVVYSLLNLQSEYIHEDSALSAIKDGRNRVRSMALIHENLYRENNITNVDARYYLTKLVTELFNTYKVNKNYIELNLNIDQIDIDVDTMVPIGLVANEMITNSLKHAFGPTEKGSINVSLTLESDHIIFKVSDNGKGIKSKKSIVDSHTFGMQMIKAFCEKLEASLTLDSTNGTAWKLVIPKSEMISIR